MNQTQTLVANLMRASSFNGFDGPDCVNILEGNEDLWEGFVWGRFDNDSELITLRDISCDLYNADTMYILPKEGKEDELEALIRDQMNADEIDWEGSSTANKKLGSYGGPDKNKVLLRVWWD